MKIGNLCNFFVTCANIIYLSLSSCPITFSRHSNYFHKKYMETNSNFHSKTNLQSSNASESLLASSTKQNKTKSLSFITSLTKLTDLTLSLTLFTHLI